MILGVGADIVKIERIEKSCARDSFRARVFTAAEIEYAEQHGGRAEIYAGMFAAKEAVAKALGTGFAGFGPAEIEVLHDELGRPSVSLYGGAKALFGELNAAHIHLSISHDAGLAAAFAVAEA